MNLTKKQNDHILQIHIDFADKEAQEARQDGNVREWEMNSALAQYLRLNKSGGLLSNHKRVS